MAATSLPAIERLVSASVGSCDSGLLLVIADSSSSTSGGGEVGRGGGGPDTSEMAESGLSLKENFTCSILILCCSN